ncbi:uncharacterized protein LOC122252423 [Penaeus japonicus]|uniref:uncharacterized protein LOC122252423 n=1 Tax=Penaeus japonicus TaxID=27405 RepID=UPI001C7161B7|nr:uncharacterized protein LOC122252423 [Penaeus japonicus]XP_042870856.1 uncharacterized protein LOC122252423 [Penaeus japonicus]
MDLDRGIPSLDALPLMDEDDVMEAIRLLSLKRDQLLNKIETKTMETDAWIQILNCSTVSELESLSESLPYTVLATPEEQELLHKYQKHTMEAQAALFLDGLVAYELDDGTIIVIFTPPPGRKYPQTLKLSLAPQENKTYRVCHHSLPNSIPVRQLEEEFLGHRIGKDGKDGVRKLVTALTQYTRAFFIRYNHVSILEEAKMFDSRIHTNSDCTLVSLLIEVVAEAEAGMSRFEFVLQYELLEIFPHEVNVRFVDGVEIGREVREQLQEASVDMKTRPFPDVICSMFVEQDSSESREEEEDNSSNSTVIFDFK